MPSKTGRTANSSAATLTLVLIVLCSCHQFKAPSSVLDMADPEITGQLITGFYPIEENSWRWVKRSFSVGLKPPENARRNGGRLTVHLYLPMEELRYS